MVGGIGEISSGEMIPLVAQMITKGNEGSSKGEIMIEMKNIELIFSSKGDGDRPSMIEIKVEGIEGFVCLELEGKEFKVVGGSYPFEEMGEEFENRMISQINNLSEKIRKMVGF